MDTYERELSEEINRIAGKNVFFDTDLIIGLDKKTTDDIVGCLLSFACQSQNDSPITLGRKYLTMLPEEWVIERIINVSPVVLELNDDWEYRRLMELSEIISKDLLRWAHDQGRESDNPDVIEAYNDYIEHLQS